MATAVIEEEFPVSKQFVWTNDSTYEAYLKEISRTWNKRIILDELQGHEERGRTLHRRNSSSSLLSDCLSFASQGHEYESRSCSRSDSVAQDASPFRPESSLAHAMHPDRKEKHLAVQTVCPSDIVDKQFILSAGRSDNDDIRRCGICNDGFDSEFDLKSHYVQHAKPFVCSQPGCTEMNGFRTTQDLEVHERSKQTHWFDEISVQWPSQYQRLYMDNDGEHLHEHLGIDTAEMITPSSTNLNPQVSCQRGQVDSTTSSTRTPARSGTNSRTSIQTGTMLGDSKLRENAPATVEYDPSVCSATLDEPGRSIEFNSRNPESMSQDNNHRERTLVNCHVCGKNFKRQCELRKHMKRHQRPYGCTFVHCGKSFGSKNDWKRHEQSQHLGICPKWRCDRCGKEFFGAAAFVKHLYSIHSIHDIKVIHEKVESGLTVRDRPGLFWCGFCKHTVKLESKGREEITERFDHIDDHFMGRNGREAQPIDEWVKPDHSIKSTGVQKRSHSSVSSTSHRSDRRRQKTSACLPSPHPQTRHENTELAGNKPLASQAENSKIAQKEKRRTGIFVV